MEKNLENQEEIEIDTSLEMEMETKSGRLMDDDSKFLPREIITEILYRLPADSVIGCRRICKQWRSLVDYPSFVDTHTRQLISSSNPKKLGNYLIPDSSSSGFFLCAQQNNRNLKLQFVEYNDHVEGEKLVLELKPSKPITDHPFPFYWDNWGILMVTSCNGLVFMGSTKTNCINDIFVCNPFTREYLNLSLRTTIIKEELRRRRQRKGYMAYGFGYLHSNNEYKVVSIYYPDMITGKGKVSVYTLGSGRWRNKGEIPYMVYSICHPGIFANGAIHWFANTTKEEIVSFDLADEEFKMVVPLPPPPPSANHVDQLGVLGGCLCVTRSDKTRCESPKEIWVLNVNTKEEEDEFSWNKRFSVPWKAITCKAEPQVIMKSGKILLLGGTGLISYDPKTEDFIEHGGSIYYDARLKVIPCTKSFVSLKALGEENAKCFGKGDC